MFSALVALAVSGGMHMGHDHAHDGMSVQVTHAPCPRSPELR